MVNADGAIKEWMHPALEDHYHHRHLSHLYPVFPGDEVGLRDPRLPAFARAADLRELGGQSGWSLTHMANIYARLGRGDDLSRHDGVRNRSGAAEGVRRGLVCEK